MSDADGVIRILSEGLINKIAAGEVIERPAAVAKELVENAIDAGATRIKVTVEQGGRRLLLVEDDGKGMSEDDAVLCVERHATSKISREDDLWGVRTLGFRGEALASIAAVARLSIHTCQRGAEAGTLVEVEGGRLRTVESAPPIEGTRVTVRSLFFNTPARRRFLRTPQTELGHLHEQLVRLGLARPDLHLRLTADGREKIRAPATDDPIERARQLLGAPVARSLTPIEGRAGGRSLRGLVSDPSTSRGNTSGYYFFVNGRFVRDRLLNGAIRDAYRGVIPRGRHPTVILSLQLPGDEVDVNVHPAKTEVRFLKGREVRRFVEQQLSTVFARTSAGVYLEPRETRQTQEPLLPRAGGGAAPQRGRAPGPVPPPVIPGELGTLANRGVGTAGRPPGVPSPVVREEAPRPAGPSSAVTAQGPAAARTTWTVPPAAPIDPDQQARVAALLAARSAEPHPRTTGRSAAVEGQPGRLKARFASTRRFSELRVIGQFDRTYLVCEDEAELVLIDQHAAHERVMFERVRKGLEQGGLESQLLLMPIALDLPPAAATALCGEREALALLGMEVEPFGGSTVALKSLPIGVSQEKAEQVLRDVASELLGGGDARAVRDVLYELASVMACHSAVRAQDRLAAHEIRALLTDLDQVDFSFACPHGRPFVVRFTLGQIERWFHR